MRYLHSKFLAWRPKRSRPDTPPPRTELDDERNRRDGEGLARPQHHNPNPPRDCDHRARTARPIGASAHPSRNRVRSCFFAERTITPSLFFSSRGRRKTSSPRNNPARAQRQHPHGNRILGVRGRQSTCRSRAAICIIEVVMCDRTIDRRHLTLSRYVQHAKDKEIRWSRRN